MATNVFFVPGALATDQSWRASQGPSHLSWASLGLQSWDWPNLPGPGVAGPWKRLLLELSCLKLALFCDQEDTLEQEMATHPSIPAWKVPWTEAPDGLPSMGSQRVEHD